MRSSPTSARAGGVETEGLGSGFAPIERIGTDLASIVEGADVIIVVTGGHRQPSVAKALAPLLRDGQTVLPIQGNTGGSLVFRRVLDPSRLQGQDRSCRDGQLSLFGPQARAGEDEAGRHQALAADRRFPGNDIDAVFATLGPLFPTAEKAPKFIHTGFMNANALLHVANCMANATRIETAGNTSSSMPKAVTPVARVYTAISDERVKAAAALGAKVRTLTDWFDAVYKVREPTLPEAMQKLTFNADGPYGGTPTPKSFERNFVAEDVPVGLMPMVALGKKAGVDMPAIRR